MARHGPKRENFADHCAKTSNASASSGSAARAQLIDKTKSPGAAQNAKANFTSMFLAIALMSTMAIGAATTFMSTSGLGHYLIL